MPAKPWTSLAPVDPDGEYLALLSVLPLKRHFRIPWFLLHAARIMRQLSRTPGLLGYSLLGRPLVKRFFTLSVWEDEAALQAFVHAMPHAQAPSVMAPHMGKTAFVRWRVRGSELPPSWGEALRRWEAWGEVDRSAPDRNGDTGGPELQVEFHARGPWVTGFTLGGRVLGGGYLAEADQRLQWFCERFPRPGRILELGALEGGHTFSLARAAEHVVAIESRPENLKRARWLQREVFRQPNITFVEANLETFDLAALGHFDVAFNCGVLYHLPRPWELLARLAPQTAAMFVWTHVASPHRANIHREGYRGMRYREWGMRDPLSGMSGHSFWPTLEELRRMLHETGFEDIELVEQDPTHPDGPGVTLTCRSRRFLTGPAG
jgi:quinol monooxygenase YgiN